MTKKSFRLSDVRPDATRDVDDELAFHLEMRAREFMEQGMPEAEARRRATESFGDLHAIRGDLRSERANRNVARSRRDWWSDLRLDLRFAIRSLAKNRAFALAAITTLALGIGANTAVFSLVNSVLLKPLPFPDADRLVVVHGRYPEFGRTTTSLPDFRDWRDNSTGSFAQFAARHSTVFNLTGSGEPVQLRADRVTANFFTTLGVQPRLGRGFLPDEERGEEHHVVVLSHGFWQRQFGGDPAILGQTIQLSGTAHAVVGIAPPQFRFWRDVDLWAPARTDTPDANRRAEYMIAFGRLKPGATPTQASAEMATIVQRLADQYPATNGNLSSEVVTLHDQTVAAARPALLVFAGAVALVLLIACANVANLLLARAAAREREIAVRVALGASRGRLIRQLLTESALVALLGGVIGLVLAAWAIGTLRASGTALVPRLTEVRVDLMVAGFSLGLSLVTGLIFGLAPAIRLAAGGMHASLKEGARGAAGGAVTRLRSGLVLSEVALAVVLLVGAGLLVRSFDKLNRVDPGFNPEGVITYQVVFPSTRYPAASLPQQYAPILERTLAVPGVRGAAIASNLPMQGAGYASIAVEGRVVPDGAGRPPEDAQPFTVSPDYLTVMGLTLQAGRFIDARDVDGALDVAVINTEFARLYIPDGRDPVGARVTFGNPAAPDVAWWTVVGVVDVVAQEGLDAKPYAQIYLPIAQAPRRGIYVIARSDSDPLAVVPGLRQALKGVDAELPMNDVQTMAARVSNSIAAPRVSVTVLTVFAGIALALAAIGIYGVLSYSVEQRTREIGIRMALGANARDVRYLIVRQGMIPALIGLALGLGGALLAGRLMTRLLYGVAPSDVMTFAVVAGFLASIAFLASYIPARRATRVAPTEALRYD
ncbi:MAG: ABC transporter permease [Gemmatimonadaceae bacterium]